jgi:hypothetical protein
VTICVISDPLRDICAFVIASPALDCAPVMGGSRAYTAITKLLENPDVSEKTTEAIAGHVSHRMKKRYSHVRIEVRCAAIQAMSNPNRGPYGASQPRHPHDARHGIER